MYIPSIKDKIKKQVYSQEDFYIIEEAIKKGDDSIKLLYIPPFALGLSLIALLLNLMTVIVMITMLLPIYNKKIEYLVKIALVSIFIFLPYFSSSKIDNVLIEKSLKQSQSLQRYITFLQWLKYYEKINNMILRDSNK